MREEVALKINLPESRVQVYIAYIHSLFSTQCTILKTLYYATGKNAKYCHQHVCMYVSVSEHVSETGCQRFNERRNLKRW